MADLHVRLVEPYSKLGTGETASIDQQIRNILIFGKLKVGVINQNMRPVILNGELYSRPEFGNFPEVLFFDNTGNYLGYKAGRVTRSQGNSRYLNELSELMHESKDWKIVPAVGGSYGLYNIKTKECVLYDEFGNDCHALSFDYICDNQDKSIRGVYKSMVKAMSTSHCAPSETAKHCMLVEINHMDFFIKYDTLKGDYTIVPTADCFYENDLILYAFKLNSLALAGAR